MKKIFLIILLAVAGALGARAQEPQVEFYQDVPDLSARTMPRTDLHGELCALVKVRVLATATFRGSIMGDVKKDGSEYWVYVTGGSKMLFINSDAFLPFMYDFPEPLRAGATYVMTIQTPQAAGGGQPASSANYLVLKVTPATARVIVDGKERAVNNGAATVRLEKGTHSYRVEALGYAPQDGSVLMSGQRVTRSVELVSTISTLTVTAATPGTEIYVNDSRKGVDRWSGQLVPDTYTVEGRLAGHRPYTRSVTLAESGSQTVDIPALVAITGTLNVEYTPVDATITIDGRAAGVTPNVFNDLAVGTHTVTIAAPGYTPATHTITLSESSPSTLTGTLAPAPTPSPSPTTVTTSSTPSPSTTTTDDPYADDLALTDLYEKYQDDDTHKYGFKHNGTVVIPAKYDWSGAFSEGLAHVRIAGKWGYIDKTGTLVIPAKYNDPAYFSEGLAAVRTYDGYGYIDKSGTTVIPAKYDVAGSFREGLAPVRIDDKWGYIDKTGNVVISPQFDSAEEFGDGLAPVEFCGLYGFTDKTGTVVIPVIYQDASSFHEGLAGVKINGKYGYINQSGALVIPAKYNWVGNFNGGVAFVGIKGKRALIDKNGVLTKYDDFGGFEEGLSYVKINGKYGFIDKIGTMIIPAKYDKAWKFSEGLALVKIKGKYGFIDKKGNLVIPAIYKGAGFFSKGKAQVKLNDRWFYIDRNGNEVQ